MKIAIAVRTQKTKRNKPANPQMNNKSSYLILLICTILLSACSNIKYLPKGELLYVGATVKITDKNTNTKQQKVLAQELEGQVRPKPNTKILGLRPKLWFYNIAGTPKKNKGLRYWVKTKLGEPPVLFSQVSIERNIDILNNRMDNRGYFRSTV